MKWYFPEDTSIVETGINSLKFDSSDDQIKMFVRELCQNSCDASAGGEVTVEFELFKIRNTDYPDRDGFASVLEECKKSIKALDDPVSLSLFKDMISVINSPEIAVMRASDFGTTGARGSDETDALTPTPWKSMTISRGISSKKGDSGGSFGRGKDSFFAVSQLHTVFFSTNDDTGVSSSIGCSNLVTHYSDTGVKKVSFGICGDRNRINNFSVEGTLSFGSFRRSPDENGTDVYIMGYSLDEEDWADRILIAAIKDFFVKIHDGLLKVKAGNRYVDKDNLTEIIRSLYDGYPLECKDLELVSEQISLLNEEPFYRDDYFALYLKNADKYNRIVSIRSGMVIDRNYKTVSSLIGLLVIENKDVSRLLSKCEPTNHDHWVKRNLQNVGAEYKKKIVSVLDHISNTVEDSIERFKGVDDSEMQDAEGLEKYLSLHNDTQEQIQVARKEYDWGVIADVRPKRKKKVRKVKDDSDASEGNSAELPASEIGPDEDFEPTGAVNRNDRERGEANRNFKPNEEGDMVRRFKIKPSVKIIDLKEVCVKQDLGIKCTLIYNVNRDEEYYLRVSAVMKGGKSAEQVPLVKVTDGNGNEMPIIDGYYAGPFKSNKSVRNKVDVILSYPAICDFRPEVFEYAN